jgi:hypothetical protein
MMMMMMMMMIQDLGDCPTSCILYSMYSIISESTGVEKGYFGVPKLGVRPGLWASDLEE